MSICYSKCEGCGSTFTDCDDFTVTCDCGECFCEYSCGKLQNHYTSEQEQEMSDNYSNGNDDDDPRAEALFENGDHHVDPSKPITCMLCRKDKATDEQLLKFLLKHFKLTRQKATTMWKRAK